MPNNAFIAAVAAAAGTYLLHSTLLVGLVWLTTRRLRAQSFALQERLWQLALLGPLLTVAVQSFWSGAAPLAEWRWGATVTEPESRLPMAVSPGIESPAAVSDLATPRVSRSPRTGAVSSLKVVDLAPDKRPPSPALPRRYSATTPSPDAFTVVSPDLAEPWIVTIVPDDASTLPHAVTTAANNADSNLRTGAVQVELDFASDAKAASVRQTLDATGSPKTTLTRPFPWLGLAVLGGMLVGLVRLLVHTLTVRHWTRRCRVVEEGRARHLLDQWLIKTNYRRRVRLMTADTASEPGAWGIVRPTILMPEALESTLTRDELRSLLAHELAHLLRRDPLWLWVGRSICAVCWWQPLNRVALRSWRQCAEHLCDDWTVERGVSAVTLAKCLTSVAAWRLEGSISPALPAAATSLSTRVERLLAERRSADAWRSPRLRRLFLLASLIVLSGLIWKGPRIAGTSSTNRQGLVGSEVFVADRKSTSSRRASSPPAIPTEAAATHADPAVPSADVVAELRAVTADLNHALTLLAETEADPEVSTIVSALQTRLTRLEARISHSDDQQATADLPPFPERSVPIRRTPAVREDK